MQPNVLIGKTITAVYLAEDGGAIRFDVEGAEPVIARADGDCCSYTWIESLDAPEALIGTVTAVVDIDMPDLGTEASQTNEKDRYYDADCISYYGCKITTDKGSCVIDYRNESNGYYGGNLSWPGPNSYFYGGVHGQNVSTEKWRLIAGASR